MTAIEDFGKLGETDPLFKKLDEICKANRVCGAQKQREYYSITLVWNTKKQLKNHIFCQLACPAGSFSLHIKISC